MSGSLTPSNNRSLFWSERKLLMCYQLLRLPARQEYVMLDELLQAFGYPRIVHASSWEAFRMLKCLISIEEMGVKIKQVELDKRYFYEIDFVQGFAGDFLLSLEGAKNTLSDPFIPVPREKIGKLLSRDSFKKIDQNGSGFFMNQETGHFKADVVAPAFFRLWLKVDRKLLRRSFHRYLGKYRRRKLSNNGHASAFGYSFTDKLFHEWLKRLTFLQGENIIFRPGHLKAGKTGCHDEFSEVFETLFPREYELWRAGKYDLRFYEHLLASELSGETLIDGLACPLPVSRARSGSLQSLQHWGMHTLRLKPVLYLAQKARIKKRKSANQSDQIHTLSIVESAFDIFEVFVNQKHRFVFKKSHKSGKLLYTLASEGYLHKSGFERAVEYINTDPRCRLYIRSPFSVMKLLEIDDEGYVIPVSNVHIELIQRSALG